MSGEVLEKLLREMVGDWKRRREKVWEKVEKFLKRETRG